MAGSEPIGIVFDPKTLYEASSAAYQQGDLPKAMALADQILQVSQYALPACAWSATLRLEAQQWQQAIDVGRIGLTKGASSNILGTLGQAHFALEEFDLAESALQGAIRLQPGHAPWLFHLARVLLRVDREFEALEVLEKGIALTPDAVCLSRVAQLLLSFGDPTTALERALKAVAIAPTDPTAHIIAAKCLMELSREDEAEAQWQSARVLSPSASEEIEILRIRFLRELGQFERATSSLHRLQGEHQNSARVAAMVLETRPCTEEDLPLINKMESLLNEVEIASGERIHLEYALGKALDDLGRYEGAMKHFDSANAAVSQSKPLGAGFDRVEYSNQIQYRKATFDERTVARAQEMGDPDETPIFVVGMIRSGTTLLEQVLARHPSIEGAGEQKFWISLDSKLVDLQNRCLKHKSIGQAATTYLRLLRRFHPGAERVVDKQPGNLLLVGVLHIAFPHARIIYVDRNPIDNAISIWNTNVDTSAPFVHDKGDLAFAIRQHEELRKHWEAVLPSDRFMTLTYESLVNNQEDSIRSILDFCGLPWSDACLTPEQSKGKVITPSLWQVRQPIYRTSVGRWKNYEPWLGDLRELL